MSCCGQKRAALNTQQRSWNRAAAPIASAPRKESDGLVPLRYLGAEPLSLSGPYSGRIYSVGQAGSAISADPLDVQVLLSTLLFTRDVSEVPDGAQTVRPSQSAQAED